MKRLRRSTARSSSEDNQIKATYVHHVFPYLYLSLQSRCLGDDLVYLTKKSIYTCCPTFFCSGESAIGYGYVYVSQIQPLPTLLRLQLKPSSLCHRSQDPGQQLRGRDERPARVLLLLQPSAPLGPAGLHGRHGLEREHVADLLRADDVLRTVPRSRHHPRARAGSGR